MLDCSLVQLYFVLVARYVCTIRMVIIPKYMLYYLELWPVLHKHLVLLSGQGNVHAL